MASGTIQSTAPFFNLFPTTEIPSNSDLNDYKNAGTYYVYSDAIASTISNMPRSASGTLAVLFRSSSNRYIQQFYFPTTSVVMIYARNYNDGSWTSWVTLSHS